jgi:imidazolonepropionase-like amidohydrolase
MAVVHKKSLPSHAPIQYDEDMTTLNAVGRALHAVILFTLTLFMPFLAPALAQPTANGPLDPPTNGPRQFAPNFHALLHATVHASPTSTLTDAAIVIRDGRIVTVTSTIGKDWAPPPGARVWDATGLHIYAGFIDAYVEVDTPAVPENQPGAHWNPRIKPQVSVLDGDRLPESQAEGLRKLGFAAAALAPKDGLIRGLGAVVSLAKPSEVNSAAKPPVYADSAFHAIAFDTGSSGGGGGGRRERGGAAEDRWAGYPGSQMGVIALLRQTFLDADWSAVHERALGSRATTALGALDAALVRNADRGTINPAASNEQRIPLWWNVGDELESLRAAKIAREFKRPLVLVGSGTEYQRLEAIKADGLAHIIPLNFPKRPDVSSVGKAEATDLRDMMAWEQAPTNVRRLDAVGLKVALTTSKLPRGQTFHENLKDAMNAGLKPDRALAMLTTHPAELLGLGQFLGRIEPGFAANLVVVEGELFADPNADPAANPSKDTPKDSKKDDKKKDPKIRDVWVDGLRHEINPAPAPELEGEWTVKIEAPGMPAVDRAVVFDADNKATVKIDGKSVKASSTTLADNRLTFVFDHKPLDGQPGLFTASAVVEGTPPSRLTGTLMLPDGRSIPWTAEKKAMPANPLAGEWVVSLADGKPVAPEAPGTPKISIAKDLSAPEPITIKVGEKSTKAIDVLATADTISYAYDNAALGAEAGPDGQAKVSDLLTLKNGQVEGLSTFADGTTHAFTLRKDDGKAKGLIDSWVIVQIDQQSFSPKAPSTTVLTFKKAENQPAKPKPDPKPDAEPKPATKIASNDIATTLTLSTLAETSPDYTPENIKISGDSIEYGVNLAKAGALTGKPDQGVVNVKASRSGDEIVGNLSLPDGRTVSFKAIRKPEIDRRFFDIPETLGTPFGPYAVLAQPAQPETLIIKNATIWTCNANNEIIENGHVIIKSGKIAAIGKGVSFELPIGAVVVDAQGQHLTPGIIDCHSHTGISRGVNEGGQAVTAEVRIQDVTNPDSISWYRQLAAGVTAVNNLHGSANPIGGQNCVNKNRWGAPHPDDLHFNGRTSYADDNPFAPGARRSTTLAGIKFALGENVKQSNWGDGPTARYPRSRMGVDTIIRDRFTAAREYAETWRKASSASGSNTIPPRRDLELEALAEILEGQRLVHCHSYRQDEIFALAKLAEEFGFKLGTYQHNLEGYKVAEAVKASARGASLFSDWWNYKVEVQDAIPQAGPIMHEVGVVVTYNSDSDELARRMNAEAGKAMRYGVKDPSEALKFVTLNAAIQLGLEARTGSIEVGKDADLALWSGVPLSSTTRCVATYVDGREYFSLAQDAQHRQAIRAERERLIQKILLASVGKGTAVDDKKSEVAGRGSGGPRRARPTDDEAITDMGAGSDSGEATSGRPLGLMQRMQFDARREHYLEMLRRGLDPRFAKCGDCGELFGHQ